MKINDAWVYDPSLQGRLELPELCIEVDEMPSPTIPAEQFADGWIVGKYGPFVKYENLYRTVTAVDFNLAFRDKFPMVIDIILVLDNGQDAPLSEVPFSIPLVRARSLVKKHSPDWRLVISDREALHGNLVWRPIQSNPPCRGDHGSCEARPASYIRVKGIDIPLCQDHIKAHNAAQAHARAAASTSK
jgi:hypothetical protein